VFNALRRFSLVAASALACSQPPQDTGGEALLTDNGSSADTQQTSAGSTSDTRGDKPVWTTGSTSGASVNPTTSAGETSAASGEETSAAASATQTTGCESGGPGGCTPQAPVEVFAIGHVDNPPANAADGDPNTRWSYQGDDAWITLDLGRVLQLCDVQIAWYQGDERTNDFLIELSDDDATYDEALAETSSGTSTEPETYNVTGDARYVRVSVTANSAGNGWASITEIEVAGGC
jgi:hypothetical protein